MKKLTWKIKRFLRYSLWLEKIPYWEQEYHEDVYAKLGTRRF